MINSVNQYPLSQLLDPDTTQVYEIPKYQRDYTWATWQWEDLFDDLTENAAGYFLGSIICIDASQDPLGRPKYEVVDGQQRLTTLSLFLAALYGALEGRREELDEEQRSDLLQLKRRIIVRKTEAELRVVPQVQNHNLEDYRGILSEARLTPKYTAPKFAGNRRIYKAYHYFERRIEAMCQESKAPIATLFELLERINSAVVVMILVSSHSDAYTLFESLNNRGTPLTAVDLMKNLLLARLDREGNQNLDFYFEKWVEVLHNLGDDYSVQERFFRHNYNAFRKELNQPFAVEGRPYPLGLLATRSNLLELYEKIILRDPKGFLEELLEHAALYSAILGRTREGVGEKLAECYVNLYRIQGAPSYLLLLYLEKNRERLGLDEEEVIEISRLLISFFVRRNLTDLPPTRDLTRLFMTLVEKIGEHNPIGGEVRALIREELAGCSASDELFLERLRGPVYDDNVGATRFVLCALAQKGMTVEHQVDLWKTTGSNQFVWTIEHIFPQGQKIPTCWVDMIAGGDEVKAKEYQALYVHTLGNLTITGYNSTLSNRSFQEKRDRLDSDKRPIGYRNGLNLNEDVASREAWTVELIRERTEKLAGEVFQMFQL